MSFIGSNPTTSASTFGTATPSTGFSFGSGDAKSVFGSPSTDTKSAFNFTSPTANNPPAFGGFAFGGKTTAAAPSSLFTSPTTTNATSAFGAKPLNFGGFTSPPNQTVGSPGFGQPVAQSPQQQQNVSFGATTQQPAMPAFGTPAPNTQAPTGMFGGNTSSLLKPGGTGFGFQTPASGFSSVQAPVTATTASAPQSTQSALSFGAATTTASQFSFGAKPGGFSFGQTTPAGSTATAAAAPAPAFSFATANQPQPQPTTAAQPQSSLSFPSPTTNLNFGGTQTTAPPAFGTTTSNLGNANQNQPLPQPVATQSSLNFGATSQAASFTSQPQTQTGLNLGLSQATNLSFPKPVTSTPTAPALNFTSQPSTTQALSFGAPQTTANLSFGTTAVSAQSSQPSSLTFPTASTVQSAVPKTSLSFGTTAAQSSSGLNFGTSTSLSFGKPAMSSTTTSAALPTSAASKPATGFGFPGTSSALPLSTASTTIASGITTLGQAATSAAMPALTTATTTTAPSVPSQITSLTFAQLEENINKWTIELEEQEKTFINQATQINAWDRLLISNGEKIVELNDSVQTVKNEQQSLDHELDFIVAQQKELQELLAPLEKQLLENSNDRMRDPEREHMYNLAENLDTQLRQMSEDLKEVIEHLNETNRSQDSNDPIVQIGRILNAHMSSMQWIDTSIAQISTKLDQLKATQDTLRRDNERSFQLTYN